MSSNVELNYNKNPFVCYFCNKEIHGETELGHTAVCGSVLVPCINKCGVYAPRSGLADHNRKCPNMRKTTKPAGSTLHLPSVSAQSLVYQLDDAFKGSTNTLSSSSNLVTEVSSLHNRCSILEQYLSKLSTFHRNKTFLDSKELERLILQNRLLEEWRDIVNLKLENIKQQLIQQELSKSEAQENWKKIRQYLLVFEKFKIDVSTLKANLAKEQNENKQNNAETNQNVTSLREFMNERDFELMSTMKNHAENIEKITASISVIQDSINQQTSKLVASNFDVKALTRISTEAVEKLEMQQKTIEDIMKEINQIKINLELLEERPESTNVSAGRLLWKVTNIEARIKKAKENGMVLQSPIFQTHEFGYKIRGHLYLNGLNKWKDRYCLVCLQVMKGDYDMTLKWPCNIEGSVILKDLENQDDPNNFTKHISAKHQKPDEENEDPQESSTTYIFIPHRILLKSPYLKEDIIYLDFQIHRCSESAKETNL